MRDALAASGTEIVTVALRRADLSGRPDTDPFANILDFIDPEKYLLLPNTSGANTAEEAVRLARLAVAAGLPNWVKLEIHPDPRYLLPDPIETLKAAEILVGEGFTVLPYINADPVLAKRLQDSLGRNQPPLGSMSSGASPQPARSETGASSPPRRIFARAMPVGFCLVCSQPRSGTVAAISLCCRRARNWSIVWCLLASTRIA